LDDVEEDWDDVDADEEGCVGEEEEEEEEEAREMLDGGAGAGEEGGCLRLRRDDDELLEPSMKELPRRGVPRSSSSFCFS